mmetsp:Transcript_36783/g.66132  ORF Transcript_36783/g.66132 Transcript_36783/m.66132 type:complete len:537 (+) Transcript_36783:53-1663(+)
MSRDLWKIVGGADKGGILVREGESVKSAMAPARLSTDAIVAQLGLQGDRLNYELLRGTGPKSGWVSIRLKDNELAVRMIETEAELAELFPASEATAIVEPDKVSPSDQLLKDNQQEEVPCATSPSRISAEVRKMFGILGKDAPLEDITVPDGAALRVVTISDIHVDYKANIAWFDKHIPKKTKGIFNVLILPGDISDDIEVLRNTLKMFLAGFDVVCFTPGNHDMWTRKKGSPDDCMAKFRQILEVCVKLGVRIRPVRFRSKDGHVPDVFLIPILSWYSSDWDREPEMPWFPKKRELMEWADFRLIKWPQAMKDEVEKRSGNFSFDLEGGTSHAISEIFAAMSESSLEACLAARNACSTDGPAPVVISYSHYVPRQELFPPKRFLLNPHLHKVSGSIPLEEQIRRIRPDLHIFGHTHLTVDSVIDNTRYVQWALGNPNEQKAMTLAVAQTGMLVAFDSREDPRMPPVQTTFWGRFFERYPRDVHETCPASFIRTTFKTRYPEVELPFNDHYFATQTSNPGPPITDYEGLFEPRWRQ